MLSFSGELKNSFEDIKASSEVKLSLDFPYLLQESGIGIKYYKSLKKMLLKILEFLLFNLH